MSRSEVVPSSASLASPSSRIIQRKQRLPELGSLFGPPSAASAETPPAWDGPAHEPMPTPRGSVSDSLVQLKRSRGLLHPIQPRLSVGRPDDSFEAEADRVAAQVVDAPAPARAPVARSPELQRKSADGGQGTPADSASLAPAVPLVQLRTSAVGPGEEGSPSVSPDIEGKLASSSGGSPLPSDTRSMMESRIGADFGGVRVHTGSDAIQMSQDLGARAFTHGNNVYFNEGAYSPGSRDGNFLLAHELTHVVQQGAAPVQLKPLASSGAPRIQLDGKDTLKRSNAIREDKKVPTLHKQFKEDTDGGFFASRPELFEAVDALIERYDAVDGNKDPISKYRLAAEIVRGMEAIEKDYAQIGVTDNKRLQGLRMHIDWFRMEEESLREYAKEMNNGQVPEVKQDAKLNKIIEKHEGKASSTFEYVGGLIDKSVPLDGSTSELEIEFAWPINTAMSVGGKLKFEAERDEKLTKARAELRFTFGIDVGIAEFEASVGGYMEAQGAGGKETMLLMSYALFKRFQESSFKVVRSAGYWMWGGSDEGEARSTAWAGKVEKQVFGEEGSRTKEQEEKYVESGGIVGVKANVGVKDTLGVEAEANFSRGTRINAESLDRQKESGGKEKAGQTVNKLNFGGKFSVDPLEIEATLDLNFDEDLEDEKRATRFAGFEVGISATAKVPLDKKWFGEKWPPLLAKAALKLTEWVRVIMQREKDKGVKGAEGADPGVAVQELAGIGAQVGWSGFQDMEDADIKFENEEVVNKAKEKAGETVEKKVLEGSSEGGIKVKITIGKEGGGAVTFDLSVYLMEISSYKLEIPTFKAKLESKKGQRIGHFAR